MGYTTDFEGHFTIEPTLKPEHLAYLKRFAETRRMRRIETQTAKRPDPLREAVGLPVGPQGAYFVGAAGVAGQEWNAGDVGNGNSPPMGQPGLWCQWTPTEDGTALGWDGGEKFYNYLEWLEYLLGHFLVPWGYVLNGRVQWQGESATDIGRITLTQNEVRLERGRRSWKLEGEGA